ncbi:hypothetical protein [Bradyrhizobium sp.]|uniref:hypothetical protein n=1 Tax=Bradyrhizobium sp. TaxID=376 RepID=UPI00262D413F|nr:hypothetical protein [Bradyrhizobium sp.]
MTAMAAITIIEDRADRVRSIHVEWNGDVRVFDKDRRFRFRADVRGAQTTWQLLSRITPSIAAAELRAIAIEKVADRCRTGWLPVADEIDPLVEQRTLRRSRFGVDLLRFPDDPEFAHLSRATILTGRDKFGRARVTGEILWIDSQRAWAVCEDGFWWTPGPEVDEQLPRDQDNGD